MCHRGAHVFCAMQFVHVGVSGIGCRYVVCCLTSYLPHFVVDDLVNLVTL